MATERCPMVRVFFGLTVAALIIPNFANAADPAEPMVIEAPEDTAIPDGGPYLALRMGVAFSSPIQFNVDTLAAVPATIETAYAPAINAAAAVGYGATIGGIGVRGELEFGMLNAEVETHRILDQATGAELALFGPSAFGSSNTRYGLANIAIDVTYGKFSPYLTAGVGKAEVELYNHGITLAAPGLGLPAGDNTGMFATASGMAWQVGAALRLIRI
jgi:opacity protein-like surface antigen